MMSSCAMLLPCISFILLPFCVTTFSLQQSRRCCSFNEGRGAWHHADLSSTRVIRHRHETPWFHSTNHHPHYMTKDLSQDDDDDIGSLMVEDQRIMKTRTRITDSSSSFLNRAFLFSIAMVSCGAILGPFLDHFHSKFGVLHYDEPIYLALWSTRPDQPALITAWWVPELFGLAGFIIGWLTIILDHYASLSSSASSSIGISSSLSQQQILKSSSTTTTTTTTTPPIVIILVGIVLFVFQYWLSGYMFASEYDRSTILSAMTLLSSIGFLLFDKTVAGFLTSLATAIGGPLIEVGLITFLPLVASGNIGYHYTDLGETGFFPLWIIPIYFFGGTVNANLARGIWSALTTTSGTSDSIPSLSSSAERMKDQNQVCQVCNGSRASGCPNCDAEGYYVTYGRSVRCNCCQGRGFVICRSCFNDYGDDPSDIESIRSIMSRMPD